MAELNAWQRVRAQFAPQQPEFDPESPEGVNFDLSRSKKMAALADSLQSQGYIQDSGWLGVLSQMGSAYAGKKLNAKADETMASALDRQLKIDNAAKSAERAQSLSDEIAKEGRKSKSAIELEGAKAKARKENAPFQFAGGFALNPVDGSGMPVEGYSAAQVNEASGKARVQAQARAAYRGPNSTESKVAALRAAGASPGEIKKALMGGGRGLRISTNADGTMTVEDGMDGMPGEMTSAATTATQKGLMGAQDSIAGLERAGQGVADNYLTLPGRIKAKAGEAADKLGLTNKASAFNAERGAQLQEIDQFFNQYRKLITGAAASESELIALRKASINGDLGPQEFQSRFKSLMDTLKSDVARNQSRLGAPQEGGQPPQATEPRRVRVPWGG